MRPSLFHAWIIGFLCLLPAAKGAEPDPNALPSGAVARLGWSPLRIGYADFALTPDGRTIVVVTPQGSLHRLDAQTGHLLECRQLTGRTDVPLVDNMIHLPILSANGEAVGIYEPSYTDQRLSVYEIASGKKIFHRACTETRRILSARLAPDGKELAVVESEKGSSKPAHLRVFDLKTSHRRDIGTLEQGMIELQICRGPDIGVFEQGMLELHFSGDGKQLLIAQSLPDRSVSSTISLVDLRRAIYFDLSSGKELWRRTLRGGNFTISHDGKLVLASGFRERNRDAGFHVLERDGSSGKWTERFVSCRLRLDSAPVPYEFISDSVLASDNRTIAISNVDEKGTQYIVSWDLRTRKEIRRFKLPPTEGQLLPPPMAISANGRTLLTNGEYLQRWDLTTGKPLFAPPSDDGLPGSIMQLAFTPDGKELFASSLGVVSGRWNIATGKRIDLIPDHYVGNPFIRTPNGLRTIRLDGSKAPSWFTFEVLDPVAHKTLHTLRYSEPKHEAKAYTLTANGKSLLAIHSDDKISYVTAWEVSTDHQRSQFSLPGAVSLPRAPFSPCGRWVVLNGALYHLGSGTKLFAPSGAPGERFMAGEPWPLGSVWFSEDSRLMAAHLRKAEAKTAPEDTLAVWELASGRELARFVVTGVVTQVAFAPDGRTIALLDAHGVVLADLPGGKRLARYSALDVLSGAFGYTGENRTLVFSPDGSTLATGHHGGSIVLWKAPRSHAANSETWEDGDAEKLWKDLGSSSPVTARTAVDRLACHPNGALALLEKRFRAPPADAKLAALINDLDSDVFATREEASGKLRTYGARAETALRHTLTKAPSLEMRRRIENILAEMKPPELRLPLSGEHIRGVRAIEVLERGGNAAALRMLRSWTEQTEDVQLAVEARLALERLDSSKQPATP